MTEILTYPQGGYRFIKGVFQYSAGVAAKSGFEIVRARFAKPLPLAEVCSGENHLTELKRPLSAFCACELRSPKPFDDAGFLSFNRGYVEPLQHWGIVTDGINPIARSNVCPAVNPPSEPIFYAFSCIRCRPIAVARRALSLLEVAKLGKGRKVMPNAP